MRRSHAAHRRARGRRLLLAAGACAIAFVLLYVFDSLNTQLLGLTLRLALVFLAVACVIAGKWVVDQRKGVEAAGAGAGGHREGGGREDAGRARGRVAPQAHRRRRRPGRSGGRVAAIAPLASLGPDNVSEVLKESPWRKGVPWSTERWRGPVDGPVRGRQLDHRVPQHANEAGARRACGRGQILESEVLKRTRSGRRRGSWPTRRSAPTPGARSRSSATRPTSPPRRRPALVCPCHSPPTCAKAPGSCSGQPAAAAAQLPLGIDASNNIVAAGGYGQHRPGLVGRGQAREPPEAQSLDL
jgi:hypothetical protein